MRITNKPQKINTEKLQKICDDIRGTLPENSNFVLILKTELTESEEEMAMFSDETCFHCVAELLVKATKIAMHNHQEIVNQMENDKNATRH